MDQVNWDYHSFRNSDSPDVEIGIFAIKTDLVGAILADFQSLGITVHGLQLAPLAVYNAVVHEGKGLDKGTIFLDIGADHTDMIVVDQGRLWLRNINLGGNSFTESLAKSFRFAFKKAESLKKTAATSKYARQIFQAMRPTFADVVAEIQRSIGYYNSSHRESRVEQIIGMGNPFRLSNLQKYLQQYLGMEVARLDGFTKIEIDDAKMAAGLSDQALGMTAAYGLALQGVGLATINTNLLPVEIARQMIWRKKYPWFAATAALFVLGAAASAARYSMDSSAYDSSVNTPEVQQAKTHILAESSLRSQYTSISNTYQSNVSKINYYLDLGKKREIWPQIIGTLYESLPQAMSKKPADLKDPDSWKIVLQSVTSTYETVLSDQVASTNGQSAEPTAPRRTAGTAATTPTGGGFQLVALDLYPGDRSLAPSRAYFFQHFYQRQRPPHRPMARIRMSFHKTICRGFPAECPKGDSGLPVHSVAALPVDLVLRADLDLPEGLGLPVDFLRAGCPRLAVPTSVSATRVLERSRERLIPIPRRL